jgi:type 1 fimbria pilin
MSTYDDASLIYYPSGYKEDKIYSLKPTDGSGDLTFTRASSATRVNSDGLIESPRTNLVLYSEEFDNAYWTKTNVTITANATTAPDGNLTADKLVENSVNGNHFIYRSQATFTVNCNRLHPHNKLSKNNFCGNYTRRNKCI